MEINELFIKIICKDMGVEAEEIVERPAAIRDESIEREFQDMQKSIGGFKTSVFSRNVEIISFQRK